MWWILRWQNVWIENSMFGTYSARSNSRWRCFFVVTLRLGIFGSGCYRGQQMNANAKMKSNRSGGMPTQSWPRAHRLFHLYAISFDLFILVRSVGRSAVRFARLPSISVEFHFWLDCTGPVFAQTSRKKTLEYSRRIGDCHFCINVSQWAESKTHFLRKVISRVEKMPFRTRCVQLVPDKCMISKVKATHTGKSDS